jgi:hypothetical protein
VQGRRQVEVAAEFGLSRRRISQICRKVVDWHAETNPWERGEGDERIHRRTDRILQRDQLTEIYGAALRAYARSEQPLVTRRSGQRDGKKWSDRSQRQQRLDTGSLRVALKAIEMQWQLADRPFDELEGKDEKARLCVVLNWVAEALELARKDAENRGAVTKLPGGPKAAVERFLREFLGVPEEGADENAEGKPREGEAPAEPAPREGAINASLGSIWEAPEEALPSAPAAAASHDAAPTCGAAAPLGSSLGSAPKIEMGNASWELPRDGVGSLWPKTTLDHGSISPAKDSRPPEVMKRVDDALAGRGSENLMGRPTPIEPRPPGGRESMAGHVPRPRPTPLPPTTPDPEPASATPTRLERLLSSGRRLTPSHRRRLESTVAHRRESASG